MWKQKLCRTKWCKLKADLSAKWQCTDLLLKPWYIPLTHCTSIQFIAGLQSEVYTLHSFEIKGILNETVIFHEQLSTLLMLYSTVQHPQLTQQHPMVGPLHCCFVKWQVNKPENIDPIPQSVSLCSSIILQYTLCAKAFEIIQNKKKKHSTSLKCMLFLHYW